MWRGGLGGAYLFPPLSSGGASSNRTIAPFPHPAHRTGRADFPHPALGQGPHAFAHGRSLRLHVQPGRMSPNVPIEDLVEGSDDVPAPSAPDLVLVPQPPAQPLCRV